MTYRPKAARDGDIAEQEKALASLHKLLVARQPLAELRRKQRKACRKSIWTAEDIDYGERAGLYMHLKLRGCWQ